MRGGPTTLVVSGVAFTSGKAIRVFGASITSGATAGVLTFRNGTSASGTALFAETGTISKNVLVGANIPANGLLFPAGLYLDLDANCTSVTVWAEQVHP